MSQDKVWKTQEYWMSFKFFKLQDWDKRSAAVRRRNCAVLPKGLSILFRFRANAPGTPRPAQKGRSGFSRTYHIPVYHNLFSPTCKPIFTNFSLEGENAAKWVSVGMQPHFICKCSMVHCRRTEIFAAVIRWHTPANVARTKRRGGYQPPANVANL